MSASGETQATVNSKAHREIGDIKTGWGWWGRGKNGGLEDGMGSKRLLAPPWSWRSPVASQLSPWDGYFTPGLLWSGAITSIVWYFNCNLYFLCELYSVLASLLLTFQNVLASFASCSLHIPFWGLRGVDVLLHPRVSFVLSESDWPLMAWSSQVILNGSTTS